MEIWTDGACESNPGLGGWGWHRSDGRSACGGEEETTNNRMEMTAILEALRELPDGAHATVYSDSQYCVKGLTSWRHGWKKKNWMKQGKPMPNRDLWIDLEEQLCRLNVSMKWVKGHAGDQGNEKADQLANFGRRISINHQPSPYATAEESQALIQPDTRTPAEKELDDMIQEEIDRKGYDLHSVNDLEVLRTIALRLIGENIGGRHD